MEKVLEKNRFDSRRYRLSCLSLVIALISVSAFAQRQIVFTINGQVGTNQKIVLDSTANSWAIVSDTNTHTLRIPKNLLRGNSYSVSNLADSSTITHAQGSTKLDVRFYDTYNKENNLIDWAPINANQIRVYLPIRDKPTPFKFSGEVHITRRN